MDRVTRTDVQRKRSSAGCAEGPEVPRFHSADFRWSCGLTVGQSADKFRLESRDDGAGASSGWG